MRPQEAMNREKLITKLRKKGLVIIGTSEEFDGTEGGIWISAEGWFAEWYDPGTVFIHEI